MFEGALVIPIMDDMTENEGEESKEKNLKANT